MIRFPFNDVDGLLSQEDRVSLRDLAERCCYLDGIFFEIGSYKGLSALCILSQRSELAVPIACFDWFEEEKLKRFLENLGDLAGRVFAYKGDFKQAKIPEHSKFSFGFVDHSHTVEDTKAAYDMFWPHIIKGGIMCFHDYNSPLYPEATVWLNTLPHKRVLETSILAFVKE